ncbi:bifunctional 2-polyprenyl-6-hydroxyphenol methylase/3-demethylubiquinol 3-O-methyltransferase UbiG [Alteromonas macleodii]|uniref:Ubiquinone biosynthesis O-methyltransferase n=1 Tax=Alteromonas macleodii TaxID=28108 RepID=A0A6T9Y7W8_ALTMA|nr:bifunctional 2-polyprenyl-6-hydroxyphenol methylase/3-demethylubiquinol 3-O-methyltransferase UbiG [Alteromonas macleodii]CAB9495683.1 Ubiquinone biosynthesis O-methyltransferase [Alteromonas macleodii]
MLDKSKKTGEVNFSEEEISRFDSLAESWWDPNGKYKTALEFNRARLDVIKAQIEDHFGKGNLPPDYSSLSIVDIGSGGGLISEPLAKLGAKVTGIDASAVSVEVAKRHAEKSGVSVTYKHMLSSELVKEAQQYDIVINAEVVEHVPDQQQLIDECASLVKPGGLLILATLNRTLKSFVIAIVGAEYVMRYLPVGTHDWQKFVKPSELEKWVGEDFTLKHQIGMKLNPFKGEWLTTSSLAVNFIQAYSRN